MQYQANADSYLETEVFTAPPQKLQLMLIDAALRQIARGKRELQAGHSGEACLSLLHASQIIDQLIAGVNRDACPELADRVLSVYAFLVRHLKAANEQNDEKKLDDVIRVLEIERETWRQICDTIGGQQSDGHSAEFIPTAAPIAPSAPVFGNFDDLPATGLSLEA